MKKYWKSQGISSEEKSGNPEYDTCVLKKKDGSGFFHWVIAKVIKNQIVQWPT